MAAGAAATAAARLAPLTSALSAPASAMTGADAAQPAAGTRSEQASAMMTRDLAGPAHQPSIFAFNQAATPTAVPALGLLPSPAGGSGAKVGAAGGMMDTPVGSPMPAHALSTLPSPSLAGFDPMSPTPPHTSLVPGVRQAAGGGPAAGAAGLMLPPPSAIVGTDWSAALPGRATAKGLSGGPQTGGVEELPPAQYLEALINRVSAMDPSGFFEEPVTEELAPGYSKVVSHPMCFQTMREKVLARKYRSWRAFMADFDVIFSNAMTYNQKKSRVHHAAEVLVRAGNKLLQAAEEPMRAAIAQLHPDGPAAAAADHERAEADARAHGGTWGGLPGGTSSLPLRSLLAPETVTTGESEERTAADGGETDHEGYSSFSETDGELEPSGLHGKGPFAAWDAGADTLPGFPAFGGPAAMDKFLEAISVPVVAQPWSEDQAPADSKPEADTRPTGRPSTAGASKQRSSSRPKSSPAWKAERRGVKWRLHWLELRLRELAYQRARHEAAYARLCGAATDAEATAEIGARREAAATQDPAHDSTPAPQHAAGRSGAAGPVTLPATSASPAMAAVQAWMDTSPEQQAGCHALQQHQQSPMPPSATPGSRSNLLLQAVKQRKRRLPVPGLQADELLAHPFFGSQAGGGKPPLSPAPDGSLRARFMEPSDEPSDEEDAWEPARLHAALDIVERQVARLQREARQLQQEPQAAPQKGRPGSGRNGARGWGGRRAGAPPKGVPGKRRRDEEGSLVTPSAGAPRYVAKAQVTNIPLPKVRHLEPVELAARHAAVVAFQQLRAGLSVATAMDAQAPAVPATVRLPDPAAMAADAAATAAVVTRAVNAALAAQAQPSSGGGAGRTTGVKRAAVGAASDASSSDEDSSDEAYAARHAPWELEERTRFMTYQLGGSMAVAQKRNPPKKSTPAGAGSGGSLKRPQTAPGRPGGLEHARTLPSGIGAGAGLRFGADPAGGRKDRGGNDARSRGRPAAMPRAGRGARGAPGSGTRDADGDSGLQRQASLQRSGSGLSGPTGIKVTINLQRLGSRTGGGGARGGSAAGAPSAALPLGGSAKPRPASSSVMGKMRDSTGTLPGAADGTLQGVSAAVTAVVDIPGSGSAVAAVASSVGGPASLAVEVQAAGSGSAGVTDANGNAGRRSAA